MRLCLIIAGSREVESQAFVDGAVSIALAEWGGPMVVEVVSGGAPGVDALGEAWARERGIPVKPFSANWDKFHHAAGPMRNRLMAQYASGLGSCGATRGALVAVPYWKSRSGGSGTRNMIQKAEACGLLVSIRPWGRP
jgi:hypothetical protein